MVAKTMTQPKMGFHTFGDKPNHSLDLKDFQKFI
jgi:hypothetical protein